MPRTHMWKFEDRTWVKARVVNSNACKKQARSTKKQSHLGEREEWTVRAQKDNCYSAPATGGSELPDYLICQKKKNKKFVFVLNIGK